MCFLFVEFPTSVLTPLTIIITEQQFFYLQVPFTKYLLTRRKLPYALTVRSTLQLYSTDAKVVQNQTIFKTLHHYTVFLKMVLLVFSSLKFTSLSSL